jgi:hypothetical protein
LNMQGVKAAPTAFSLHSTHNSKSTAMQLIGATKFQGAKAPK